MQRFSLGLLLAMVVVLLINLWPFVPLHEMLAQSEPIALHAANHAGLAPPPLPRSCIRGAPLDDFAEAVCCVSGYVYLNGQPIADAEVSISIAGRTLTTRTEGGSDGRLPSFGALLNGDPLYVRPGDNVTITASAWGQSTSVSFSAHEGGQQIDLVLPQSQLAAAWTRGEIAARNGHAMAYDAARQRVVLFGGSGLDDTWEWDGTSWTRMNPAVSPPARMEHAMVYDAARQRVVLFGGFVSSGIRLDDTWEWDGINWVERQPTTRPAARMDHAMAYDSLRQRVVLYGGSGGGGYLNDTWEWDGSNWQQRPTTLRPTSTFGHAMAYDEARQRVVLFSGASMGYNNETWEWDGTNWIQLYPLQAPPGRRNHALTYDSARQRIVLFGGHDVYNTYQDVWEWDGEAWSEHTTTVKPSMSNGHALAYDAARQRSVLFNKNGTNSHSTWEWDGITWHEIKDAPIQRPGAALEYTRSGESLLFGGLEADDSTLLWNGSIWRQLDHSGPRPSARSAHRMARDGMGAQVLLFGGLATNGGYLNDTWLWLSDSGTWQQPSPATRPAGRANYGLTFDSQRNVWLLFGGQHSSAYLADTWEFDGSNWTQRTPATSPTARSGATLTYDPVRGRAVLIGGQNSRGHLDEVWEWDGNTWINATPEFRLSARSGHAASFDTLRRVVVIAGGNGSSGLRNDTWEWDGSFWRERTNSPALPAMHSLSMSYDPLADRMVAIGGETSSGYVQGVYLHRASGDMTRALPVATISRVLPRDARQGVDVIRFEGRGADPDLTTSIVAYRWSLNGQVISNEANFSREASAFTVGVQRMRLEVQNAKGDWSLPVEQEIIIRAASGAVRSDATSWTLLIYAVADNNLDFWMGNNRAANGMLYRLERAAALSNVQVAVLYDGPGVNDTRRYTLDRDGYWQRVHLGEKRMDEPETLRDFLSWSFTHLQPTDHYALAIADHANGIIGIGQDNTSKGPDNPRPFLTPLELRMALEEATDNGARKLDVIFYDGCSFGLFENAAIAADLAHFVIASANTAWGIFAYEHYRQIASSAADPRSLAVGMANHYATAVNREELPYTIAVFDMAHFNELDAAISDLGNSLLDYIDADPVARRAELRMLRSSIQKYDAGQGRPFEPDDEDSYVDLVHLAQRVAANVDDEAVQAAADQVIALAHPLQSRFVIHEAHASRSFSYSDPSHGGTRNYNVNLANAHGLGIYYPPRGSVDTSHAFAAYVQHQLFHITRDNGWTSFLAQGGIPPQLSSDPPPLLHDELIAPFIPPGFSEAPEATPSATASAIATASATPMATPSASPSATPTAAPSASPSATTSTPTPAPELESEPEQEPEQRHWVYLPAVVR